MDFVSDYRTKQKLAERLRAREKALTGLTQNIDYSPIVTQGQGAAPTQVQANWGAPLAAIGSAYFANKAGENAETAETEAEATRLQALQSIMGQGAGAQGVGGGPGQSGGMGAGGVQMTPEKALQLQNLGIDTSLIKTMLPKAPAFGAMAQATSTPEGRAFLLQSGQINKEQYDSLESAAKTAAAEKLRLEREQYDYEQANKRFAPTQGRGMTEIEFAQSDPEGFARYQELKAKAKGSADPYVKKAAEEQAKIDVKLAEGESKLQIGLDTVDELIKADKEKPYTKGLTYQGMDAVSELATGMKASNAVPEVQIQEQAIQQFHLNAMEQMRGFGQVTENEQKIIAATQFSRYDSAEARSKKLQVIKDATAAGLKKVQAAKQRLKSGNPSLSPSAAPSEDEMEEFYNRGRQ